MARQARDGFVVVGRVVGATGLRGFGILADVKRPHDNARLRRPRELATDSTRGRRDMKRTVVVVAAGLACAATWWLFQVKDLADKPTAAVVAGSSEFARSSSPSTVARDPRKTLKVDPALETGVAERAARQMVLY